MITCLDLEGVLLPEIWIEFAKKTSIESLKLTTRDIPNYDELMQGRINILTQNNLKLKDIEDVISSLKPLEGANDFLKWLKSEFQVIILSDTFYQFSQPLMKQLDFPTLFCHNLITNDAGQITGYKLRQKNGKAMAVKALQGLNFDVIAGGDSYNDIGMLEQADVGILFNPPNNLTKEFPQFSVATNYNKFKQELLNSKHKLLTKEPLK
jgi:phosphoserine / homoserine phosphotransferase|tara:strand:+ start:5521 stop:6147 length:627 start_codon:yes stop_codon:yes gene_type:complete